VSILQRHRGAVLALVCVAAAVALGLLAVDVRAVRTTVSRDDIRFRALPAHRSLWRLQSTLPGNPAAELLGSSATIAYRRALQLFWYSRIGMAPEAHESLLTVRAEAQQRLQDVVDSGRVTRERSAAANLLGVLIVTTRAPSNDRKLILQILRRGAGYFQRAITIDPANADAKQNLELVLRISGPGRGHLDRDARAGYGFGRGRALIPTGSGY
jgi:hypothetical protein